MSLNALSLAIDLGATKVAIGVINSAGQVISRENVSSKAQDLSELNNRVSLSVKNQMSKQSQSIDFIGIGSAGPIDPIKGMINPVNIPLWKDFQLIKFIQNITQIDQIALVGDASALTYAEFKLGAGRGSNNLLGVTVSTGIGGGLVLNGRFFPGNSGNAGYIGHSIVEVDGEKCACGVNGCVEAYSSGPNMIKFALSKGLKLRDNNSFAELAKLARENNEIANLAIQRGIKYLATGLLNATATLDLDRIVIGGGVLNASDVYLPRLQNYFSKKLIALGFAEDCTIVQTELQQDSGLIGAGLAGFSINPQSLAV